MTVTFFGQYLLERGVLSAQQYLTCVEYDNHATPRRLRDIAIALGLLERGWALDTYPSQASDQEFAEAVLASGELSQAQVSRLYGVQRTASVALGQTAVDLGFLSAARLQELEAGFARDSEPYATEAIEVPEAFAQPAFARTCVDLTSKFLLRIGKIFGPRSALVSADPSPPAADLITAEIDITGSFRGWYAISTPESIAAQLAAAYTDVDSGETVPRELLDDCLREFCNTVCGHVCAKLNQGGFHVTLGPPHRYACEGLQRRQCLRMTIDVAGAPIELRIAVQAAPSSGDSDEEATDLDLADTRAA